MLPFLKLIVQFEDMNGLSVGGAGKEGSTGREGEGIDGCCSFETTSQLIQLGTIMGGEDSDDRPLLTGRSNPGASRGEL